MKKSIDDRLIEAFDASLDRVLSGRSTPGPSRMTVDAHTMGAIRRRQHRLHREAMRSPLAF